MGKCELEVLISTFGAEGLRRVATMALPEMDEVKYLVSCQCPGHDSLELPPELQRKDVKVIFTPTKGLSVNRNNAISHATAPLCLISDDDLSFTPEGFRSVITVFGENPDLDVATFQYTVTDGRFEKSYPSESFPLSDPAKGYFVTSFEIAFRRESVIKSGVWFNRNFGLGAPLYGSGEEELWIKDLLDAGLNARFYPYVIAAHADCSTTGVRLMDSPPVLRAAGAVIKRLYPATSFPRVLLKAWRSSRASGAGLGECLRPLLYGWWQATVHPKKLFHPEVKQNPAGKQNPAEK